MQHGGLFLSRKRLVAVGALALGIASAVVVGAGTLDPRQQAWVRRYQQQVNAPDADTQLLNESPEPVLTEGFESLFNGTDLSGWTPRGGASRFEAENGCIVGTCKPGSPSTYLCTDAVDFSNFLFTCDMKWRVDGNTGVMFRARVRRGKKGEEIVYGPQAEMEEFEKGRGWSGGVYGQSCGGYFYPLWLEEHRAARRAMKKEDWNRLTILAEGNVVKTWVNGVPAAHWVDRGAYPKGFFGLQVHSGKKGVILWKNLRVKKLP